MCWPCLRVAQGERERKTEQILHPAIRPRPGSATRPPKVRPLPIIEVFLCNKQLGLFCKATITLCGICAFAFYNSPKERVFLLFKGVTEVKATVTCLEASNFHEVAL